MSGNVRTLRVNQPTGYNLRNEISNYGTDGPPVSYRILRSVHQLDEEFKTKE